MPNQSTNARGVLAPLAKWGGKKEPPSAMPEQWGGFTPGFGVGLARVPPCM